MRTLIIAAAAYVIGPIVCLIVIWIWQHRSTAPEVNMLQMLPPRTRIYSEGRSVSLRQDPKARKKSTVAEHSRSR